MTAFPLATRTKRHPLSKPQLEALRVLADCRIRLSAGVTRGDYVTGTAAAALERRGLVKRVDVPGMPGERLGYQITTEGLKALDVATPGTYHADKRAP